MAAMKVADAQSFDTSGGPPAKLLLNPPQKDLEKRLSHDQLRSCMKKAAEISEHDKWMLEPGKKIEQGKQDI